MKKLFIILVALLLGTIATWAQELSFTIWPETSGIFNILYSTYKTPSTNAMQVDWGDGKVEVYNDKAETGSDPSKLIFGTVTAGIPIKLYSECINAIYIFSPVKSIMCGNINPFLEYIYYFHNNLIPEDLEAFYMSLYDRSGKSSWGELHLTKEASAALAGNNILKSNAFIPLDKKWEVCSWKSWTGSFSARTNWHLNETVCYNNLIPAITIKTPQLANMTDFQIGIKDSPQLRYFVYTSLIRIDDGSNNHKSVKAYRYFSDDDFVSKAPKLTVKGTGIPGLIRIYGAMVSHIKTNQISSLDLTNATNLRYLYINNAGNLTSIPGLNGQKSLYFLDLSNNLSLKSVNAEALKGLETLKVNACPKLTELNFNLTNLQYLSISRCISLPYMALPTLRFATKLSTILAENLAWDACTMDAFYNNLISTPPSGAKVFVDDASYTEPSNDWGGSNKTIATDKGWTVYRYWNGSFFSLTGNGGGCNSGISEVEAAQFITLYPNPATDRVNISIKENLNAENLQVIDFTGKTIYSMPISSSQFEYQINVSDYTKGIYLIRVGDITRKLFVK